MSHPLVRTEILIGRDGLDVLAGRHVLVVGMGGVGGAAAEAIGRGGIGTVTLMDHDVVSESNLNRQLVALHSTLGRPKVEVMAERIRDISPPCRVITRQHFLQKTEADAFIAAGGFDFVLDCIDSLACKTALIAACLRHGTLVASSMGAGGRLDPGQARVGRLKDTINDPLAREIRANLRKLALPLDHPVVFSTELPRPPLPPEPVSSPMPSRPRAVNGTMSYMPGLFGIMLAGVAIQGLLGNGSAPR